MIVTFTKSFAIRIVANKCSESFNKVLIRLSVLFSCLSTSFISLGEREKKAISDADTNAEHPKSNTANKSATIALILGVITVTPSNRDFIPDINESESKEIRFS